MMQSPNQRRSAEVDRPQKGDDLGKPITPVAGNTNVTTVEYTKHPGLGDVDRNIRVIDEAVEAIGVGRFQWQLALSCGLGFLADQVGPAISPPKPLIQAALPRDDVGCRECSSLTAPQILLISISLVGPQLIPEFAPRHPTLLPAASYAGLLVGAVVMGLLADNVGRRAVWQLSIFGISVCTMLAASAASWAAINSWVAVSGFFGGGNRTCHIISSLKLECCSDMFGCSCHRPDHSCREHPAAVDVRPGGPCLCLGAGERRHGLVWYVRCVFVGSRPLPVPICSQLTSLQAGPS